MRIENQTNVVYEFLFSFHVLPRIQCKVEFSRKLRECRRIKLCYIFHGQGRSTISLNSRLSLWRRKVRFRSGRFPRHTFKVKIYASQNICNICKSLKLTWNSATTDIIHPEWNWKPTLHHTFPSAHFDKLREQVWGYQLENFLVFYSRMKAPVTEWLKNEKILVRSRKNGTVLLLYMGSERKNVLRIFLRIPTTCGLM